MDQATSTAPRRLRVQESLISLEKAHSLEAKVTAILGCLEACRNYMGAFTLAHPLVQEYVMQVEPWLAQVYTEEELLLYLENLVAFVTRMLASD